MAPSDKPTQTPVPAPETLAPATSGHGQEPSDAPSVPVDLDDLAEDGAMDLPGRVPRVHLQEASRDADDEAEDSDVESDITAPVPPDLLRSSPIEARGADVEEDLDSGAETDGTFGRAVRDPARQRGLQASSSQVISDDEDSDGSFVGSVVHPALRNLVQSDQDPVVSDEESDEGGIEEEDEPRPLAPPPTARRPLPESLAGLSRTTLPPVIHEEDEEEAEEEPVPLTQASPTPPLHPSSPVMEEEDEDPASSGDDDAALSRPAVQEKGKRRKTAEEEAADEEEENRLAALKIQAALETRLQEIRVPGESGDEGEGEEEEEETKLVPDTSNDPAIAAALAQEEGLRKPANPVRKPAKPEQPKPSVAGPSVPSHLRGRELGPDPLPKVEAEQEDEDEEQLDLTRFKEIKPDTDTDTQYPPLKHRTPATDDAESGVEAEPRYLLEWLAKATNLSPALAAVLVRTPQGVAAIMEAARTQSAEAALVVSTRWAEKMARVPGLTTLDKMWQWTTAYTDVTHSADFRRMMAGMEFPANASDADHRRIMDTTRDFLHSMLEGVGKLEAPEGGSREDLDFVKNRLTDEIKAAMKSLGATAYGEVGTAYIANIAKVLGTLAISAMPFAYAYYSEPTAFFYIVGLTGAYLRTSLLATGMMFHRGTTGANIWEHVKERQLIWALPAAFYSIQQYMITYAHDHPANEEASRLQKVAEAIITNTGFLAGVGIAEFGLFAGTNHPDAVRYLWRKISRKSKSARLAKGQTLAVADAGTADDLRKYFKAGSTLIDVYAAAAEEWTADGERMSDAERQNLKEMRVDMAQLGGTLELVIGGVTKPIAIADGGDDEEAQHKSIIQRATDFTVGAGKAVWNMPQAIRDLPAEQKAKIAVGLLLSALGAVLGLLSSLGAIRIAALLTDYIPYYLASVLLIVIMMFMDSFVTADLARTFGSYFGGTMIGLIPSIINLVSEFAAKEGFFDIVGTTADPHQTNSTFTDGHPALPITDHAGIHGASGRVNFGVIVAATMIAIFAVGGRLGDDISKKMIAGLKHATGSNDGDGDSRVVDITDEDDDADADRRDDDQDAATRSDALTRAPKTDLGIAPPTEGEPLDLEGASKNLKELGKEVPPDTVKQIEKYSEVMSRATAVAMSLRPKDLKFDPANPPADASDDDIETALQLAALWENDFKGALEDMGSSNKASTSAT